MMKPQELRKKLEQAFENLDHMGIAARENFSCCNSCGQDEIQEYSDIYPNGYVFWHMQDDMNLESGRDFCLSFGAFKKGKDVEVAKIIIQTLEHFGIQNEWNGTVDTRIKICP